MLMCVKPGHDIFPLKEEKSFFSFMAWFQSNFGFKETSYTQTRAQFQVDNDNNGQITLTSLPNQQTFFVGSFELPSVADLRSRLNPVHDGDGDAPIQMTFKNIGGNARSLHLDPANQGSVFAVASQFNCLEMVGPGVRPEDGVTNYARDRTQGPVCAMACPAATVFRNYFVNGGQHHGNQLDGASDIALLCDNNKHKYWDMANGYLLPTRHGAIGEVGERIQHEEGFHEAFVSKLRVGIHWNTETEKNKSGQSHRVCQVFSSACPVAYANKTCRSSEWAPFATSILEATFEAVLLAGAIIAQQEQRRVQVFLTQVGAGAFGNSTMWVEKAISRALTLVQHYPLDIQLVHYGTKPASGSNKFIVLEKKWKQRGKKTNNTKKKKKDSDGDGGGGETKE